MRRFLFILTGPPGSGKDTLGNFLFCKYGMTHISNHHVHNKSFKYEAGRKINDKYLQLKLAELFGKNGDVRVSMSWAISSHYKEMNRVGLLLSLSARYRFQIIQVHLSVAIDELILRIINSDRIGTGKICCPIQLEELINRFRYDIKIPHIRRHELSFNLHDDKECFFLIIQQELDCYFS